MDSGGADGARSRYFRPGTESATTIARAIKQAFERAAKRRSELGVLSVERVKISI